MASTLAETVRSPRRTVAPTRVAVRIGLVLVLVPFVVAAVMTLAHEPATAIRDHALMELRTRDIGVHPVLLGLYSRDGWSHPGPLIFFTLAVPYRILGQSTSGMVVGALGVNALSIAGMAAIARRLGGRRAALVLLVTMSVVVHALGADFVRDPWVLFISVFPFGLFCCLIWALVMRRTRALAAAAFVGSWLVQTHVGYAPLVVPMLLVGAGVLAHATWRSRDANDRQRVLRASLLAAAVVAVAWAGPVWDQLVDTGNLRNIVDWFSRSREGVHTVGEGIRVVLGQFAAVPDWVTGERRVATFNGETLLRTRFLWPVLFVPFFGAIVVAWRRRDRSIVRLAWVLVVAVLLGVAAVARTVGVMYEYRLLWIWVLGALGATVVVWTAWNTLAARWSGADGALTVVVLVALLVLSAVEVAQVRDVGRADWDSASIAMAARELAPKLTPAGGQVLLSSESPSGEWYLQGILLALEKRGLPARVRSVGGGLYPRHLVVGRGRIQDRFLVLAGAELGALDAARLRDVVAYGGSVSLRREMKLLRARDAANLRQRQQLEAGSISRVQYALRAVRAADGLDAAVAIVRIIPG